GTPRQHATVQNPYIAQARLTKDPLRGARTHTRTTDEYHRLPGRRELLHSPAQLSQGNVARTCKMPGGELRRLANVQQRHPFRTLDGLRERVRPDDHRKGSCASGVTLRGAQPNAPVRPSMRSSGQNPVKLD